MAEHPYQNIYTGSRALIIGINAYVDPQWPLLGNAERDAQELCDLLTSPRYNFQTRLLLGEQATKQAIQRALFALRNTASDDRVLFYFSGHGYSLTDNFGHEAGYLACYDTQSQEDFTALALDEITGFRSHAKAKHIAFIFDACFSGQALGLTKSSTVIAEQLRLRRAYQVLSAGAGDQTVSDWRSMTRYLLPVLRDPASLLTPGGLLTLETLGVYLKQVVTAESGGQQIPQHGQITGSQGGDFIFYEPPPARPIDLLPDKLRRALTGDDSEKRYFAVAEAERLLGDPQIGEATREVLDDMSVNDDDREVRRRAKAALRAEPTPPVGTGLKPASTFGVYRIIEQISPTEVVERELALPTADPITSLLPPPFEWCDIPAGQVTLEEDAGTFEMKAFKMAKFPVTYAQWQIFVDAKDGFRNPKWWRGLIAEVRHRKEPGKQRWKVADHPRENVSWLDAVAFTRWLTIKVGYEVRLPTEWEWQWAAQGPDGRKYPWGDAFDENRCNTGESVTGQTTPVTRYPNGESPFHVTDMAGNVWEWCLNTPEGRTDLKSRDSRCVLRGGSWASLRSYARVVYRYYNLPFSRSGNFGFRVCMGRSPSL